MADLIAPHGGILVERQLAGSKREALLEKARGLPKIRLHDFEVSDLDMLACGALSPLQGFMGKAEVESVLESMRLPNGTVWSLPIVLARPKELVGRLSAGDDVALTDHDENVLGVLHIEDIYAHDQDAHAKLAFGTQDEAHPGVARVMNLMGNTGLGGKVSVLNRVRYEDFREFRLDPKETRAYFAELGWKTVSAFQTRNPIHRAHEYLTKVALEVTDGLLIHPLVGATKGDDIPADVRMKCYEVLLANYYPKKRVKLAVFPAAMRYGGPREAIFHALCRKNYGVTHFIVGRDHAGVKDAAGKSYYGDYDAQNIFDRFKPEEIGVEIFKFEHTYYDKKSQGMVSFKTAPENAEAVSVSGTKLRDMLAKGEIPPPEVTRPEVAQILIEFMKGK
ncbi:MAG: sulfate adenylyltransferase [Planctomycetota bacterium]|nr:sulfate adenylyltransferase [Planctomycetota bacterium]